MKSNLSFFRYLAYAIEIILLTALQSTPGLMPQFLGAKPFLLLAFALAVSAREDFIPAMILAAVSGVFSDLSSAGTIGYFSVTFVLVCCAVKYFVSTYLNPTFFTYIITSAAAILMVLGLYFIIFRLYSGMSDPWTLFLNHYLSRMAVTLISAVPLYFINLFLYHSLGKNQL